MFSGVIASEPCNRSRAAISWKLSAGFLIYSTNTRTAACVLNDDAGLGGVAAIADWRCCWLRGAWIERYRNSPWTLMRSSSPSWCKWVKTAWHGCCSFCASSRAESPAGLRPTKCSIVAVKLPCLEKPRSRWCQRSSSGLTSAATVLSPVGRRCCAALKLGPSGSLALPVAWKGDHG